MRFSIRDVLWLTVVVGMALAWRLHMAAIISAYDEQARLGSYEAREMKKDVEAMKDAMKRQGFKYDPSEGWSIKLGLPPD